MVKFWFKIRACISVSIVCWNNPHAVANLKMAAQLFEMIMKVASERSPMMQHVGFVHPEIDLSHEIVSIWAGAGMSSDPTKRISDLLEENRLLKEALARKI